MLLINETRERLLIELGTTEGKDMEALMSPISDSHNLLTSEENAGNNRFWGLL